MDVARPHALVSRSIDADVLRVLAGTNDGMTGRHVHRMIGRGAHRTVQLALGRLAGQGLVDVREYGPSKLYTFNRDHLAADPLLELIGMRGRLLDRLRSTLALWEPAPAHASLFGSAARGDGDEESDIDLLIVQRPDVSHDLEPWRTQVDQLRDDVGRWTGNRAAISELSESDVRAMLAEESPIAAELDRDAITLAGPDFSDYTRRLK